MNIETRLNNNNFRESDTFPNVPWTFRDVVEVSACIMLGALVLFISIRYMLGTGETAKWLSIYPVSLLMLVCPFIWTRKKYGIRKEILGLRKGKLSPLASVILGLISAIIYSLLFRFILYGYFPNPSHFKLLSVAVLLKPVSILGFYAIILSPVAQEIWVRGFVYAYFRKKFGSNYGLLLQAILFSILHLSVSNTLYLLVSSLLVGLILGILFERTKSLYPSMICHGCINYLIFIRGVM